MFYCEPCRRKYHWPESIRQSTGTCEACKKPDQSCYDVAHVQGDYELAVVRRTAGMRAGMQTVEEVIANFHVDPRQWPKLFQVHRTGLVSPLPYHRKVFAAHMDAVHANHAALGIR